jgi:hypothetical protein
VVVSRVAANNKLAASEVALNKVALKAVVSKLVVSRAIKEKDKPAAVKDNAKLSFNRECESALMS